MIFMSLYFIGWFQVFTLIFDVFLFFLYKEIMFLIFSFMCFHFINFWGVTVFDSYNLLSVLCVLL